MAVIQSVNKSYLGSSAPNPKDPNILIYKVEDVDKFPARDAKGVKSASGPAGELTLKTGKKGIGIYVNPSTLSRNDAGDGEYPARGFIHTVAGTAPGDELALNEIIQNYINQDSIVITKGCESDSATRLHGAKCAPMELSVEETDNNDATSKAITAKQTNRYKYKSMHYTGSIPPIEEYATKEEGA